MALVTMELPDGFDTLAPDGSEIRLLPALEGAGACHCTLRAGEVSAPVRHRTVEEIWYVVAGSGEVWRKLGEEQRVDPVRPGVALTIPLGCHFQFRAARDAALEVLIWTVPPWPGADEAAPVPGRWPPTVGV